MEKVFRSDTINTDKITCTLIESYISDKKIIENHCHLGYEIIVVTKGSSTIIVEGKQYLLSENVMIVLPPLTYHCLINSPDRDYHRITLIFESKAIPSSIKDRFDSSIIINPILKGKDIIDQVKSLENVYKLDKWSDGEALIESCLVALAYKYSMRETNDEEVSLKEDDKFIRSVSEYINSNLDKPLTIDEISSAFFRSKSAICHAFKEKMKISIRQYILQKKITFAQNLIKEGYSAYEASNSIGYSNYANFYKMYVKIYGYPPSVEKKNVSK